LKKDRNLGLGKLLDYTRVLKLDQTPGFPLSQLEEIQRTRNYAVHAGLLVNTERYVRAQDLDCFNTIIKYFGL
jgi:hypothetical protein